MLKIDEGDSLGAAKIRLKSLICATSPDLARKTSQNYDEVEIDESVCDAIDLYHALKDKDYVATIDEQIKKLATTKIRFKQQTPFVKSFIDTRLKDKTIYMPQMAPIHFPILKEGLKAIGYNIELLPDVCDDDIEEGLSHVNNDACFPAIVVIGQLLNNIKKGVINKDHSALLLAQTCGPCRATNYTALLK